MVLDKLVEKSLYANQKKCFWKNKSGVLGTHDLVRRCGTDGHQVQVISDRPKPMKLRELRGFLGLTGYYCKFVAKNAQLA